MLLLTPSDNKAESSIFRIQWQQNKIVNLLFQNSYSQSTRGGTTDDLKVVLEAGLEHLEYF